MLVAMLVRSGITGHHICARVTLLYITILSNKSKTTPSANTYISHTTSGPRSFLMIQLVKCSEGLTNRVSNVITRYIHNMKREKTNKMQQSDVYYQLLSQHVSGIIMPIFRRIKTVLLHMVQCSGSAGCGWQRLWGAAL